MMAYLRYAVLTLVAIAFVTLALANRALVTVQLLPDTLASLLGFNLGFTLPLFMVLGLAIALGLMLGFVWEWLREHSYRAEAARARREADALRAQVAQVEQTNPAARKDDVLALLDAR
jgi:lipopolysaccharide assembly protein A